MSNTQRQRPSKVIIRDVERHAPATHSGLSDQQSGGHTTRYSGLQAALKPLLLLALGIYFAYMVIGGSLQNYISPQHNWLAVLASTLFLLVGLAGVLHLFRTLAEQKDNAHHGDLEEHESQGQLEHHGYHGHHHRIPWTALLIATVPLLLGLLVPSRPLGAAALQGRAAPVEFVRGYTTLPENDPSEWNMLQWQRAFNSGVQPSGWFEGQKASVVGFIVDVPGTPAGHFVMGRWVMRHCAADAYGLGLLASGQGGDMLPTETWVRVKGSMGVINLGGEDALVLRAESVDSTIGQPDPAYIFQFWNPEGSN